MPGARSTQPPRSHFLYFPPATADPAPGPPPAGAYWETPTRDAGARSLEPGWGPRLPPGRSAEDTVDFHPQTVVPIKVAIWGGWSRIPAMQGLFLMFLAGKGFQNPHELFLE